MIVTFLGASAAALAARSSLAERSSVGADTTGTSAAAWRASA
jgi:hypothetical protein